MKEAPDRFARRRSVPPSRTHCGHPERSAEGAQSKDPALLPATPAPPSGTGDYWVYILTNPRRTVLYIGVTNGLLKRVAQHTPAAGSSFAGRYRASMLIHYENFPDARTAIAREKQLKHWTRAKKETLIARLNPEWVDLGAVLREKPAGVLQRKSQAAAPGPSTPLHSAQDDELGPHAR